MSDWQALDYDLNSQLAGSLIDIFQSPGSGNFDLAEGSQAIDTGSSVFAYGVGEDIAGTIRPGGIEHDIGAYEADVVLSIKEDSLQKKPLVKQRLSTHVGVNSLGVLVTVEKPGTDVFIHSLTGQCHIQMAKIRDSDVFIPLGKLIPGFYQVTILYRQIVIESKLIFWPG